MSTLDIEYPVGWTVSLNMAIGDVAHLKIFHRHIIVINSHTAAVELLEKRGAIYSDRPYLAMSGYLYVPFPISPISYSNSN